MKGKKCIYCDKSYDNDSEHVFPHGLGGEKVFVDFVCTNCNSKFSGLESELYQKSPVAITRSIEGIKGYKKNNGNKAFLKAPILLTYDEDNKIVYEISQHDDMKIILKPQIIDINGKYYLEGSNQKNVTQLAQKLKDWKNNSFTAITKLPSETDKTYNYIKFSFKSDKIVYDSITTTDKIKNAILIQDFPENHQLFNVLSPRLFVDDNQNIKVRAKTVSKGVSFLLDFMKEPRTLKSFNKVINDNRIVYVGQSFLSDRLERAVVKITLNILIHYFPIVKTNSAIKKYIGFVNTGLPKITVSMESKNELMDSNDKSHNIFIHQFRNNISLRLSLFNGQVIFTYQIPNLEILNNNEYYRFVNDYINRRNRFENKNDMLRSYTENELNRQTSV